MTKEEFAEQMEKIVDYLYDGLDAKYVYEYAVDLMVKCLYSLGYTEGVYRFKQIPKLYF